MACHRSGPLVPRWRRARAHAAPGAAAAHLCGLDRAAGRRKGLRGPREAPAPLAV